jgi:hypothetical protein
MYGPDICNSKVLFKTDNMAVKDILNSQSSLGKIAAFSQHEIKLFSPTKLSAASKLQNNMIRDVMDSLSDNAKKSYRAVCELSPF